ncbi:MAG: DivIVA domain-containing protein [Thermoleophilia bacterium]|nr:DivIVA domain-containing protein [Thermoleophilia bacterium]
MKITPLDIRRKEFKRSMRGYSDEEVDIFLDEVADEFERLFQENMELQDRAHRLDEQIAGHMQLKDALEKTLISAQLQAEELRSNAHKESELILRDAELKARGIVSSSYSETQKTQQALVQLKLLEEDFRFKFRSLLEGYLRLLKEAPITVVAADGAAVTAEGPVSTAEAPPLATEEAAPLTAMAAAAPAATSPAAPAPPATAPAAPPAAEPATAAPDSFPTMVKPPAAAPQSQAPAPPATAPAPPAAMPEPPASAPSTPSEAAEPPAFRPVPPPPPEPSSAVTAAPPYAAARPEAFEERWPTGRLDEETPTEESPTEESDTVVADLANDDEPVRGFFFGRRMDDMDDTFPGDEGIKKDKPRDFEW